ncbi:hypothetical protein [Cohnella sp. JJ-181]|uniref:hypothetical protein n=1 Tax=Cohnella rhizoplanae TaxID=2974897 RepID=UPI0022FFC317|nr:hypothetical protein [Cohnella sp. JJ-181]CAI6027449.1 hypothetical protein COHCIP112018_00564 [Cohnella sp. JJ-181]
MHPWVTLVIAGAAIAGYGWLKPEPKEQAAATVNEEAYDRLLEDLETENRELVDAVAAFKREQDDTVSRLGRRIRELERQMEETVHRQASYAGREAAAARAEASASDSSTAAMSDVTVSQKIATVSESAGAAAGEPQRTGSAARPEDSASPEAIDEAGQYDRHSGRVPQTPLIERAGLRGEEKDAATDRPPAIRERYAELLALYERGRSVEQVAKAMNMNKGEVQLILQLAKREVSRP